MSRASEQSLSTLHGAVAEVMLEELRSRKDEVVVGVSKSGDPIKAQKGLSPAMLAQMVKFLKDNGIDAPAKTGSKLASLAAELENMPDDIPLFN